MNWLFASGGQSIGASASVLPVNIQGWFPLGLTGPISLPSKGLSRAFSSTTVWKHRFFIFVLLFVSQRLKSTGCFRAGYFCPEKTPLACISWIPECTGSGFSVGSARGVNPQTWLGTEEKRWAAGVCCQLNACADIFLPPRPLSVWTGSEWRWGWAVAVSYW